MMLETQPQRVSRVLHESGASAWERATHHPMVRAIGDGSLPHEVFRGYFEQNVLYLQEYARAIALIVAKAPDRDAIVTLTRFLSQIVENEIPANIRFLERLGGDVATLGDPGSMHPSAYAYTRHLLSACALGDCAAGLTAVLPCQWSYGELARPLMAHPPEDRIYADWIGLFGSDEYDGLVATTTALLDRVADFEDEVQMSVLTTIFERSTRYEIAFWDMAYGSPRPGERRPDA
jgi:thiaminase (transcriptional activator TenA)